MCASQPPSQMCVGVATESEVSINDFATLLPHAQIAQHRGHQSRTQNQQEWSKRKLTASQWSKTVVIVVVKMLVFVIFCNWTQQRAGGTRVCPGCVANPYFIRLVPRCSTLLRKVPNARFAVRGPSKGGFMVWPSGQSPCEAKDLRSVHLLNVVQQKSVAAHHRQKYVGQQCGSAV